MAEKSMKYFQAQIDKNKPHEAQFAEFIDKICKEKGLNNKQLLFLALSQMIERENLESFVHEAVKGGNSEIINEIRDIKLMIRGLAGNINLSTLTTEEEKNDIETVGFSKDQINESDLNF